MRIREEALRQSFFTDNMYLGNPKELRVLTIISCINFLEIKSVHKNQLSADMQPKV